MLAPSLWHHPKQEHIPQPLLFKGTFLCARKGTNRSRPCYKTTTAVLDKKRLAPVAGARIEPPELYTPPKHQSAIRIAHHNADERAANDRRTNAAACTCAPMYRDFSLVCFHAGAPKPVDYRAASHLQRPPRQRAKQQIPTSSHYVSPSPRYSPEIATDGPYGNSLGSRPTDNICSDASECYCNCSKIATNCCLERLLIRCCYLHTPR